MTDKELDNFLNSCKRFKELYDHRINRNLIIIKEYENNVKVGRDADKIDSLITTFIASFIGIIDIIIYVFINTLPLSMLLTSVAFILLGKVVPVNLADCYVYNKLKISRQDLDKLIDNTLQSYLDAKLLLSIDQEKLNKIEEDMNKVSLENDVNDYDEDFKMESAYNYVKRMCKVRKKGDKNDKSRNSIG